MFHIIIPARYGSTRLPAKPLRAIAGIPLVIRVARQALKSEAQQVRVATDHAEIQALCHQEGIQTVMTSPDHPNGTSRLAEAVDLLGLDANAIVVNVQGDEPLIPPHAINQVAQLLVSHPRAKMSTLAHSFSTTEEWRSPHNVKVLQTLHGEALHFTRSPIPFDRDSQLQPDQIPAGVYRHVGLYGYRAGLLRDYVSWSPSPWEGIEQLEQLRVLFHGERIQLGLLDQALPPAVDTEADVSAIEAILGY
jgi:3-deoxy-manno-octulosonate cytidylyltransferase (CMP-KDO synthetase)